MAYCKKCGAYIPDNQNTCLACGYDEQAAAAYAQQEADERAAAEERRRKQQEADRRWAEAELERRQRNAERETELRIEEERRRQEAERYRRERDAEINRRWKEADEVRRQREKEARMRWEDEKARRAAMGESNAHTYNTNTTRSMPGQSYARDNDQISKVLSVLSYFSILFLIPMIFGKENDKANFHAKQGMRLFIFNIISDIAAAAFAPLGLLKLFGFYCMIKGIGNAVNDRQIPLPYIGDFKV